MFFLLRLGTSEVVDAFGYFCNSGGFPVSFPLEKSGWVKIVLQDFGLCLVVVFRHT